MQVVSSGEKRSQVVIIKKEFLSLFLCVSVRPSVSKGTLVYLQEALMLGHGFWKRHGGILPDGVRRICTAGTGGVGALGAAIMGMKGSVSRRFEQSSSQRCCFRHRNNHLISGSYDWLYQRDFGLCCWKTWHWFNFSQQEEKAQVHQPNPKWVWGKIFFNSAL